jgi:hypothetical protein
MSYMCCSLRTGGDKPFAYQVNPVKHVLPGAVENSFFSSLNGMAFRKWAGYQHLLISRGIESEIRLSHGTLK